MVHVVESDLIHCLEVAPGAQLATCSAPEVVNPNARSEKSGLSGFVQSIISLPVRSPHSMIASCVAAQGVHNTTMSAPRAASELATTSLAHYASRRTSHRAQSGTRPTKRLPTLPGPIMAIFIARAPSFIFRDGRGLGHPHFCTTSHFLRVHFVKALKRTHIVPEPSALNLENLSHVANIVESPLIKEIREGNFAEFGMLTLSLPILGSEPLKPGEIFFSKRCESLQFSVNVALVETPSFTFCYLIVGC